MYNQGGELTQGIFVEISLLLKNISVHTSIMQKE